MRIATSSRHPSKWCSQIAESWVPAYRRPAAGHRSAEPYCPATFPPAVTPPAYARGAPAAPKTPRHCHAAFCCVRTSLRKTRQRNAGPADPSFHSALSRSGPKPCYALQRATLCCGVPFGKRRYALTRRLLLKARRRASAPLQRSAAYGVTSFPLRPTSPPPAFTGRPACPAASCALLQGRPSPGSPGSSSPGRRPFCPRVLAVPRVLREALRKHGTARRAPLTLRSTASCPGDSPVQAGHQECSGSARLAPGKPRQEAGQLPATPRTVLRSGAGFHSAGVALQGSLHFRKETQSSSPGELFEISGFFVSPIGQGTRHRFPT